MGNIEYPLARVISALVGKIQVQIHTLIYTVMQKLNLESIHTNSNHVSHLAVAFLHRTFLKVCREIALAFI